MCLKNTVPALDLRTTAGAYRSFEFANQQV